MAHLIAGPAAGFLEARRDELNRRFERARRRWPRLEPDAFSRWLAQLLPPLAGAEPGAAELMSAIYDLVLLHAGRETFAARPGVHLLLRDAFPAMRALLLQRPGALPAALSNAVENLGERGEGMARALPAVAGHAGAPDALLRAGAVLAWRLGEPRLRAAALAAAPGLPPGALLAALGLDGWPHEAAPLAVAALAGDAWTPPEARLRAETIAGVPRLTPEALSALAARLARRPEAAPERWVVAARVGNFAGFGGPFEEPPVVLQGADGPSGDRHAFLARTPAQDFAVVADAYGWAASPVPPAREGPRSSRGTGPFAHLVPDASAFAWRDGCLVASLRDSHRLRVIVPREDPL